MKGGKGSRLPGNALRGKGFYINRQVSGHTGAKEPETNMGSETKEEGAGETAGEGQAG